MKAWLNDSPIWVKAILGTIVAAIIIPFIVWFISIPNVAPFLALIMFFGFVGMIIAVI